MRGALIHGALLAVMLVYGYQTWTRDKTVKPTQGSVALWDKKESDLLSIEYKAAKKIVKIERKPEGYWWGSDTVIETRPKKAVDTGAGSAAPPPGTSTAGSASAGSAAAGAGGSTGSAGSGSAGSGSAGSGSAGSAAGSGSAAKPPSPPPPPEDEEVSRKTREFPLGETAEKLIKDVAALRALRDLGVPKDDNKKDYKLDESKTSITVTFKDGPKTFLVGGLVYGGSDRYVVDQSSGKAYVFSRDLISGLEVGESSLHLLDPRGFDAAKIEEIAIESGGKSKTVVRMETETDGQKRKTWADADTKKPNQTAANFVDNANNLRPTEYAANLKISDLTPVLKLTYRGANQGQLGTLTLYRYQKPGQLAPDQELDPANPPKGETEYYVVTEKTRVPGLVRRDTAERTENDIETVFSGKPANEGTGSGAAVQPKGNPFGTPGAAAHSPVASPPAGQPHGAPPGAKSSNSPANLPKPPASPGSPTPSP
jgi:hypothetical protein